MTSASQSPVQVAVGDLQSGRFADAEKALRKVLAQQPDHFDVQHLLGMALLQQGKATESVSFLLKATKLKPDDFGANYNLGCALIALGQHHRALAFHQKAITLDPRSVWAQLNYGISLAGSAQPLAAITQFEYALTLDESLPAAWDNLAKACHEAGNLDRALVAYQKAAVLDPLRGLSHFNLGVIFTALKRFDDAQASYRQALSLQPDFVDAGINLANLLFEAKQIEAAVHVLSDLYARVPDAPMLRGLLLHMKMHGCHWTGIESMLKQIDKDVKKHQLTVQPFAYQGWAESEAMLKKAAQVYSKAMHPGQVRPGVQIKAKEKINIGYVSGEFRHQATALLHHDEWPLAARL